MIHIKREKICQDGMINKILLLYARHCMDAGPIELLVNGFFACYTPAALKLFQRGCASACGNRLDGLSFDPPKGPWR
jgi:hypothetical protein